MKELIQLKSKDIKSLKEKWHQEQNGVCPILKKEVPLDDMVLDHLHKNKNDDYEDGKGCCRGTISRFSNSLEGKITNNFKRMGLDKEIDLPSFLRNLADFLENNHLEDDVHYIHPTEATPIKILQKSSYNQLKKVYVGKAKFPEYKPKQKLTKPLEKLFKEYNVEPKFY